MWPTSTPCARLTQADMVPPPLPRSGLRDCGDAVPCRYYYHAPRDIGPHSPVIVSVHGISRNAAEHLMRMREQADAIGALLIAPWFDRQHYHGYQQLLCRDGKTRADRAMLAMVADATARFPADGRRIYLSGFSGGGQFTHRFALVHADRVAACVTTAAGWYTFPDPASPWPQGTGPASLPPGLSPHPAAQQVPIHVLVGSRDDRADPGLNTSAAIIAQQGSGRLSRARAWVAAMQSDRARHGGAPVTLTVIDRLAHDFTKAMSRHALDRLVAARLGLKQTKETTNA